MTLDDNAYGTVADVAALTRIYLHGESTYNSTTAPQGSEVEDFLNRASGTLNLALSTCGFAIPIVQADAKRACQEWSVEQAVRLVEFSQPTSAMGSRENERGRFLASMYETAVEFVKENMRGFQNLGVAVTYDDSSALLFTGEAAQADRSEPSNTALEQPKFTRRQFDA